MLQRLCLMMLIALVLCGSSSAFAADETADIAPVEEVPAVEDTPVVEDTTEEDVPVEDDADSYDYEEDLSVMIEDSVLSVLSDEGIMVTADISSQYGLGTSNIEIFGAIASKLDYGVHYVYYRDGQYDYCLAYSDSLELSGTTFSGEDVTIVTYSTSSNYNSQATFSVDEEANFSLSAGRYLVWSDLGDYPILYDRGAEDYAKTACIILASFGLYYLFKHLWDSIRQRFVND